MSQRRTPYRRSGQARRKKPTMHDLTPEQGVQIALQQALTYHRYRWWHIPKRAYAGTKCPGCGHAGQKTDINPDLPDLLAVGPQQHPTPRLLFIECKTEGEKPTEGQDTVLTMLRMVAERVGSIHVGVCSPSTLDQWLEIIQGKV